MKTVGVGMFGCGSVGAGVARILLQDNELLAAKSNVDFQLQHVVVRETDRRRDVELPQGVLHGAADRLIDDPEVHIAVELIGGVDQAEQIVRRCLEAGKHVVTANKALLALRGEPLFSLARQCERCIAFEASCAGGIPIVGGIRSGLIANHIEALHGILNGTANYILTEMTQRDRPYREALEDAQAKGYAEADPTLDVDGTDSAHKLAILGAIAFSKKSDMDAIYVEGIDDLDLADLKFASELGYVTKLLAIGERLADGLSLRVHPALIRRDHPLAAVNGSFNAVSVVGRPIGHTLFYGRGAGRGPTASAVVADLVDVALGNGLRSFRDLHHLPDQTESVSMAPIDRITCRYYLRFNALDRPGTIAKVSGILGDHAISISGVSQHEQGDGEYVPLVVLTNPSQEGNVQDALQKIDELDVAKHPSKVIRIVEPKHEDLE